MSYCTKCGKQNLDTAKFCTGCGIPLTDTNLQTPYLPAEDTDSANTKTSKKKTVLLLSGITVLLLIAAGLYFFVLKKEKKHPVMMVIPESLKLRSSMSDVGEENVISSVPFGGSVEITDSTGAWYKVKTTDGQTGYMHSKYLAIPQDYYVIDAILKSGGQPDFAGAVNISESRFKKSLLRYFKNHNYIPEISTDIKEKYFSNTNLSNKEIWNILPNAAAANTILKGNFYTSTKKSIALLLQSKVNVSHRKLVIFNYDDIENEISISEFEEPTIQSIWLVKKEDFLDFDNYNNRIFSNVDVVGTSLPGEDFDGYTYYIFRNGNMVKDNAYYYGD